MALDDLHCRTQFLEGIFGQTVPVLVGMQQLRRSPKVRCKLISVSERRTHRRRQVLQVHVVEVVSQHHLFLGNTRALSTAHVLGGLALRVTSHLLVVGLIGGGLSVCIIITAASIRLVLASLLKHFFLQLGVLTVYLSLLLAGFFFHLFSFYALTFSAPHTGNGLLFG